ncbi:hypothetical protein QR680_009075 [Steinernema hermaphroditum]|uniref:Homeobox domain-containing protein n=1 Tax=Steinernema hermaphroditum TaxID=289476 RepID=A0AA39IIX2_9BILA|nr:hypothetical protein QR680_009075 [Steinernema hermaphroditum]
MTTLYTVEQLELLRRLRGTGISIEMVAEAYRTMDQMDTELDKARMAQVAALQALLAPKTSAFSLEVPQQMDVAATSPLQSFETSSPILLQHLRSQAPVPVTISASASTPPVSTPSPTAISSVQTVPLPSTASDSPTFLGQYPQHERGPSSSPNASSSVCRPIRSQRTPMREITTLDDPRELEEFMRNGEEECIAIMKQFITQYSLRQTTVAMMTGVSQPYISKMLNGNHKELSLRCRKNIYSWYLNIRRHPQKLAAFLNDPQTRLETNGDGELIPQRRERYVFRPVLIRLLEGFFSQTPFPDMNRRVEIATACNQALQIEKKGVGLMPKEVVSPQVVANWFANKRKELRRRSNEGVVPSSNNPSQVPSDSGSTPSPSNPSVDENEEKPMEPIQVPAIKPTDFLLNPTLALPDAPLLNLLPTTSAASPTSTPVTFFAHGDSQAEEARLQVPRAAAMLSELTARLQTPGDAAAAPTTFASEFEQQLNASSMLSSFLNGVIASSVIAPEAISVGIKPDSD